jgi:hypothetical protein
VSFIGDGGAYISESCASSGGDAIAESNWRTLSHWVWVVSREVESATLRDEEGVMVEEGPWKMLREMWSEYALQRCCMNYLCSSFSRVSRAS